LSSPRGRGKNSNGSLPESHRENFYLEQLQKGRRSAQFGRGKEKGRSAFFTSTGGTDVEFLKKNFVRQKKKEKREPTMNHPRQGGADQAAKERILLDGRGKEGRPKSNTATEVCQERKSLLESGKACKGGKNFKTLRKSSQGRGGKEEKKVRSYLGAAGEGPVPNGEKGKEIIGKNNNTSYYEKKRIPSAP